MVLLRLSLLGALAPGKRISVFFIMGTPMQTFNSLVARAIPFIPRALVQKISRRYIAGDDLAHALARVQKLNAQGFCATLDILGETVSTQQQAAELADAYTEVLHAVAAQGLKAQISIKPSALGLLLDEQLCERLTRQILEAAERHSNAVCIDMEDVSCTQKEIALFQSLKAHHPHVSLALQAYLLRTYQDLELLVGDRNSLRICKGIYLEDPHHLVPAAWNNRSAINPHFLHHVTRGLEAGSFVAIATHDAALIEQVVAWVQHKGIERDRFEFQMLLGVCEPLRDRLLAMGFSVRIYVPFGKDWYGYSTRRLKETPRIAGHVARALIGL